jgi:hypothetical protein
LSVVSLLSFWNRPAKKTRQRAAAFFLFLLTLGLGRVTVSFFVDKEVEDMLSHRVKDSVSWFALLLAALFLLACQPAPMEEEAVPPPQGDLANSLTEAQVADGWQLLFNGEDLEGWRGFRMDEVSPEWKVENGTMHFYATHGGEGFGDIMTREQYANFILELEWKLSAGCNSGILFRVTEDYEQEYMTGPEMQVIDGSEEYYPELKDTQQVGANYGLHPASKDTVKPVGEWNHVRLVADGAHVEHWLNGETIVEYELWTDAWKEMVSKTKFAEWPGYGMNKKGHIVLQDHGAPVWYRNVKIKVLDE